MDRPNIRGGIPLRPRDRKIAQNLEAGLLSFDQEKQPLPGIHDSRIRGIFLEQLLESIHRVTYVSVIRTRNLSERNTDPYDVMFDPVKAAVVHQRQGRIDEAFWMVFLFVHFGMNPKGGWRYARDIYGCLGSGSRWDWERTSTNIAEFRKWLADHQFELKREGVPGGFGNHRKYESLCADSPHGTGAVVESYVSWVGISKHHHVIMEQANQQAGGDPRKGFDILYQSMQVVARFGRTARFDYLAMIGKLGLAPIEPGFPYLQNSNGPLRGARLLFGDEEMTRFRTSDLDSWLFELGADLGIGMQVIEDALCNWQKSPAILKRFRG